MWQPHIKHTQQESLGNYKNIVFGKFLHDLLPFLRLSPLYMSNEQKPSCLLVHSPLFLKFLQFRGKFLYYFYGRAFSSLTSSLWNTLHCTVCKRVGITRMHFKLLRFTDISQSHLAQAGMCNIESLWTVCKFIMTLCRKYFSSHFQ